MPSSKGGRPQLHDGCGRSDDRGGILRNFSYLAFRNNQHFPTMKKLLFALSGLLFSLAAAAQDFKITHGPYLCDMTRDGVTVVWTTSKPALSWVEVAPDDGRSFYAQEHTRYYQTVAGRKLADRTLHAVRIKGLKPGTDYCYRIFSQEVTAWPQRLQSLLRACRRERRFPSQTLSVPDFPRLGRRLFVHRLQRHPRPCRLHGGAL